MRFLNKRGTRLPIESLIAMILLSLTLVIIIGLIVLVKSDISGESWDSYLCWGTNHLKSSSLVFSTLLPSSCILDDLEEPVDMAGLAKLHLDTWWQYGSGKLDLGSVGDEAIPVFSFFVKEDVQLNKLYNYMFTHAGGKAVDFEDSDYNYIQKGSFGPTLCFDVRIMKEDAMILNKGKRYFILFMDDQRPHDYGDKVIISKVAQVSIMDRIRMGLLEADYACVSIVGSKMTFGKLSGGASTVEVGF